MLWSDIPNNRIMRWDETDGPRRVFRQPSNNTNGHTVDRQGRLVSCEHLGRRVIRTEFDGSITVLADRCERQAAQLAQRRRGQVRRLDLVHRPGLRHRLGLRGRAGRERDRRAATSTASIRKRARSSLVADDFVRPNGLAFSPDERSSTSPTPARPMWRTARATSASSTSWTGKSLQGRRSLRHLHGGLVRRLPRSTRTAGSGPRRRTACTATTPTAR